MLARAIGQKPGRERGSLNTMESGTKSTNAGHFSPEGGLHIVFTYPKCQFIGKVKSTYKAKWPIRLELIPVSVALLLPPGWDASPSQGYPQH